MSTLAVAEKDFRDSVRSRALVALVVLFGIFAVGGTYLFAAVVPSDATGNVGPALNLLFSLSAPIAIFVPLIGIVTRYKAIVGERTSGTVKLLLSLPHTRRDVVLGKVVGRIGVLAVAIIIGFVAAGVVAFVFYDTFPATEYVLFTLATVLLGAVYLVFAVSLSASTGSRSVALWGALGFFIVFQFLWGILVNLVVFVANGLTYPSDFSVLGGYFPRASAPDWYTPPPPTESEQCLQYGHRNLPAGPSERRAADKHRGAGGFDAVLPRRLVRVRDSCHLARRPARTRVSQIQKIRPLKLDSTLFQ
jgi:ABC-2 type transport system permease protein